MPYDPRAVANYLLELAGQQNCALDPMKIQKLVYYAHGWHLALTGKPLIDRPMEAWQYGPVIPDLYRAFSQFGAGTITEPARYTATENDKVVLRPYRMNGLETEATDYAKRVLRRILEQYGKYSAIQLSMMTHAPDTPWAKAWSGNQGRRYVSISDDDIEQYFKDVLKPIAA